MMNVTVSGQKDELSDRRSSHTATVLLPTKRVHYTKRMSAQHTAVNAFYHRLSTAVIQHSLQYSFTQHSLPQQL